MQGNKLALTITAAFAFASSHVAPVEARPVSPPIHESVPNNLPPPWRDAPPMSQSIHRMGTETDIQPRKHRALLLDIDQLRRQLDRGLSRSMGTAKSYFAVPLPEGGYSDFALEDSGAMPTDLAKKYPQLRSLKGADAQGRRIRVDLNRNGLVAMVWDEQGSWHVQPVSNTSTSHGTASGHYMAYRDSDLPTQERPIDIDDIAMLEHASHAIPASPAARATTGNVLHNFRMAISTASSFTNEFGGTVEGGLSGVVRAVNQINEIYENDLGVHFTLVADNDKLIRTDPNDDIEGDLHQANIEFIDRVIGSQNYDVGHYFFTEFGGNAGAIGNSCLTDVTTPGQHKAAGFSGHPNPAGDPLFPLIFAHEMGHKLGAWHTFNGCGKTTLDDRAFEPGSGSTVMSYAGTGCGGKVQQLQLRMDPYFHGGSIEQMSAWLASRGGQCSAKRLNRNSAAWIDPASILPFGSSVPVIPVGTPFALDAKATHVNPNVKLSYTWEQMDVGPEQTTALVDDAAAPIFRSYRPSQSSLRVFPRLAALLGNEPLGLGEIYPQTTRPLNFRLTVRDNYGTLATTTSADAQVQVLNTGKAFAVTAPKALDTWKMGTSHILSWDMASTQLAPIGCTRVSAHLSIDGGYNYLHEPLAEALPNTGSFEIKVPTLPTETSRARVRVSCDNNIFFAVSPGDFIIRQ